MKKVIVRLASAVRWFAGVACIGFMIVLLTAPSLFGMVFVSSSAAMSVFLYATLGAFIGYLTPKKSALAAVGESTACWYDRFNVFKKTTVVEPPCGDHV